MNGDKQKLLIAELGEERVKFDEKLAYHTHAKVGGPAEFFYIATTQKELINALNLCNELKIPYFVFGNGTKILISDQGMKGFIIRNRTSAIKINGIKGKVGRAGIGIEEALVEVDSGVSLRKLNEFLINEKLKEGIFSNSMNATVGGAVFVDKLLQNMCQKILVWEKGDVFEIEAEQLNRYNQIVLSLILKVKAKD